MGTTWRTYTCQRVHAQSFTLYSQNDLLEENQAHNSSTIIKLSKVIIMWKYFSLQIRNIVVQLYAFLLPKIELIGKIQ